MMYRDYEKFLREFDLKKREATIKIVYLAGCRDVYRNILLQKNHDFTFKQHLVSFEK